MPCVKKKKKIKTNQNSNYFNTCFVYRNLDAQKGGSKSSPGHLGEAGVGWCVTRLLAQVPLQNAHPEVPARGMTPAPTSTRPWQVSAAASGAQHQPLPQPLLLWSPQCWYGKTPSYQAQLTAPKPCVPFTHLFRHDGHCLGSQLTHLVAPGKAQSRACLPQRIGFLPF